MKRYLPIILIITIFIAGLGILSYPLVSSVINNYGIRNEARQEFQKAENMESDEISAMFAQADEYNHSLLDTVILTDPFDEEAFKAIGAHYEETFNAGKNGLIGYIDIPKINVYLPIYHGTSTEVLAKGAGHLENTSLPVGGKSTHSVISAHTAYPTETFFDYLTDMEEGDIFQIHVLNRDLTYEVDQIKVVLPNDTSDLYIVEGEDLVTLLTCTPYSINSHRLLVRGKRVEDVTPEDITTVSAGDDHIFIMGYKISYLNAGLIIAGFLLFVGIAVFAIIKLKKTSAPAHSGKKESDKDG